MNNDRNIINSIVRGLRVLTALSEKSSPLTLTELSHQLDLSKSTIQRLTYTLQHLGYLDRDMESKKYYLGSKAFSLGFSIIRSLDLKELVAPILKKLSGEINETTNLAILDGTEIVYIEKVRTRQILNINLAVGSRLPVYCTSMGKAILAFLPGRRLDEVLKKIELKSITPNTIKSKKDLRKELERVRERGYATNNQEYSIGVSSVSAPVRNFRGDVIAAVNISFPSIRVSKEMEPFFAKKIMKTADKISFSLGYSRSPK